MAPSVTVLIPTRARFDVFRYALQGVQRLTYPNLTILVSDNDSQDGTEEFVKSIKDDRIRYVNPRTRLSMSHHWEFAIEHVETDWLTIVGDDDGLLEDSIEHALRVADELAVHAVRGSVCNYRWPEEGANAVATLSIPATGSVELRQSSEWLGKAINGEATYNDLPVIYAGGFVNVEVLRQLREKSSSVFRSCIPDVYSGFAIASQIDGYAYCNRPFAIAGSSKHSTGRSTISRYLDATSTSGIDNLPWKKFIQEGEKIPYHQGIPLLSDGRIPPVGHAFSLESYLQSAHLRSDDPPIDFQQQLEIILSQMPEGTVDEGWLTSFCNMYGLKRELAEENALRLRKSNKSKSLRQLAFSMFRCFRSSGAKEHLKNVCEASLFASSVVANKRSTLANLMSNFGFLALMLSNRTAQKLFK